ncbi:unnamed protein product [Nesidiocoris tenuis]|uniref:Transmembrane protein 126A n=1 Tax=Nesidiocoris tenuis TaxID=355587 RepID=A0A6H5H858_9HEMI|nr:unnamed protein product [Nesidiocoris tenuis]
MSIIKRGEGDFVPPDYVKITSKEALEHQLKIIGSRKPSEVWAFAYGPGILTLVATTTGAAITGLVRRKLKLQQFGRIAMLAAGISMPAVLLPFAQHKAVVEGIVMQNHCPVCLQLRSAAVQAGLGIAYPTFLSFLSGFYLAERYATYRLPLLNTKTFPEYVTIARGMVRPLKNQFLTFFIINTLAAMFITDRQGSCFYRIMQELNGNADD